MKKFFPLGLLILLSGLIGCAPIRIGTSIDEQTVVLKSGVKITMYGVSIEERELLFRALNHLSIKILESIKAVSGRPCSQLTFDDPAICHWDRTICLRFWGSYETVCEYLWHEAGHARIMVLGPAFEREWKNTAGNVYGVIGGRDDFPKFGILEQHGSINSMEDIACWVKAVYFYCNGFLHPFGKIDSSDPRYMAKLNLLFQYGFVTAEEYNKVAPLLR